VARSAAIRISRRALCPQLRLSSRDPQVGDQRSRSGRRQNLLARTMLRAGADQMAREPAGTDVRLRKHRRAATDCDSPPAPGRPERTRGTQTPQHDLAEIPTRCALEV
jgi:hypothetical protein